MHYPPHPCLLAIINFAFPLLGKRPLGNFQKTFAVFLRITARLSRNNDFLLFRSHQPKFLQPEALSGNLSIRRLSPF